MCFTDCPIFSLFFTIEATVIFERDDVRVSIDGRGR